MRGDRNTHHRCNRKRDLLSCLIPPVPAGRAWQAPTTASPQHATALPPTSGAPPQLPAPAAPSLAWVEVEVGLLVGAPKLHALAAGTSDPRGRREGVGRQHPPSRGACRAPPHCGALPVCTPPRLALFGGRRSPPANLGEKGVGEVVVGGRDAALHARPHARRVRLPQRPRLLAARRGQRKRRRGEVALCQELNWQLCLKVSILVAVACCFRCCRCCRSCRCC